MPKGHDRFIEGLSSDFVPRAIETLKVIDGLAETAEVENESGVLLALMTLVEQHNDERTRRALEIVNHLIDLEPANLNTAWARELRGLCLRMCEAPLSQPIMFNALRVLARSPQRDDLKYVAYCIQNWPVDLYPNTKPTAWLTGLDKVGADVEAMLLDMIRPEVPEDVRGRAQEALEALRIHRRAGR